MLFRSYDFANKIIELAQAHMAPGTRWATLTRTTTANYPLPAERPLNVA